jgi:hypothetical protein
VQCNAQRIHATACADEQHKHETAWHGAAHHLHSTALHICAVHYLISSPVCSSVLCCALCLPLPACVLSVCVCVCHARITFRRCLFLTRPAACPVFTAARRRASL